MTFTFKSNRAKGGVARAASLTPEERKAQARNAAKARWDTEGLPLATHVGVLKVGDAEMDCYVLENGERLLSTRGVMKALKRTWRGRKYSGTQLPVFLEAKNLTPFIREDYQSVLAPIEFRTNRGGRGEGYKAEILPAVCEIYLDARQAGNVLTPPQLIVAQQCEILVRAFSRLGIIALVDEATGYQDLRPRDALQAYLEQIIRKELAAWVKRFPDEFYKQIYRLRGWNWPGMGKNRFSVVAHYTKDIVYERLAPGVLEELEAHNPKDERGRRKSKHHQWLTDDVGHPMLSQHLFAIMALQRASADWDSFMLALNQAFPKRNETLELPFFSAAG
ncbi:hypothetical protein ASG32_25005 [Methylobacterium sp. Leaf361]|uniref:P63C domain-containing protein n=1 Tax=Methylobacterium sp. Leaf361 TaxID=1736352 RepID=UPI0006FE0BA1|nr:P63C domain-containing protein [Methylobacterium sp. Leaf361]KQS79722.1 hypothetical protein ASG32_25005 [Methylobacterium sp. Leaf361]